MKVTATRVEQEPEFVPVTINIRFESKLQMVAFHALFNCSIVCDFLGHKMIDHDEIRAALIPFGAYDDDGDCTLECNDYLRKHFTD